MRNRIDSKGFTSEASNDYAFDVEGFSLGPKWAIFSGPNQHVSGSALHKVVQFDTLEHDAGLASLWNTASFKFTPEFNNAAYTFRIDALIPNSGSGDPVFHLDFEMSGIIVVGSSSPAHAHNLASINRQGVDLVVRTQGGATPDHEHFHGMYTVGVTSDLFTSGAHFYMASSGRNIAFMSCTLMIKEG